MPDLDIQLTEFRQRIYSHLGRRAQLKGSQLQDSIPKLHSTTMHLSVQAWVLARGLGVLYRH